MGEKCRLFIDKLDSTQEEIRYWLKVGNLWYYLSLKLLSTRLFSKNLKIKIYKTIILTVVPYGCETWPLTLKEGIEDKGDFKTGSWGEY